MAHLGDLAELLDANLSQGVAYVEVEETINFGDLAGPDFTAERSAFAEALAGTADKKSKAYKAARRNVERWVKGRKPMLVSRRRIAGARRLNSERLTAFRRRGGEMRILVSAFSASRPGWLPPKGWVHIARDAMRRVLRTWSEGAAHDDPNERQALLEEAAEDLFVEFLQAYKIPNPVDWLRDSDVTDLRLVPTR